MSRTRAPHAGLAALVLLLASLGNADHAAAQAAVSVRDDLGRIVRLSQPARRIVSLAPHTTELLFAAGAGGNIVGAVEFSNYPPAAQRIPRVGGYRAPDLERIIALRPDLVVAWADGSGMRLIETLKAAGLHVFVSAPRSLEDIARTLQRLGTLAGTATVANAAARAFHARRDRLRARYQQRRPVSLFYEIWDRPLMTVNGKQIISQVMTLCGGRNIFAELKTPTPTVSVEAVLAANPQAIVASGMETRRPDWLNAWRRWRKLHATQHGNLFSIAPDLLQRPTPRMLDGAQRLCEDLQRARRPDGERKP